MKKTALILCIFLTLVPSSLLAAAFTSKTSGNWSSSGQTTWNEVGVPGAGDTVTIANGHTVTQDGNITVGGVVVEGRLTMGSGFTLTMGGALTIGNGSAKDGRLDFGDGSSLALGENNLVLNNCTLSSNATSGSWAVITGTGAIATGSVYASPKQAIDLQYVSFQNTGSVTMAIGGTSGAVTNSLDIQHCTFVGTGAITFGLGGYTPITTKRDIRFNDFRNISGNITLTGLAGTVTDFILSDNTFDGATTRELIRNNANGYIISSNVISNLKMVTGSSKGIVLSDNFVTTPTTFTGGSSVVVANTTGALPSFTNNYTYISSPNQHIYSHDGLTGGTGTINVSGNVFENPLNGDASNSVMVGVVDYSIYGNLQIGGGSLANNVGEKTGSTVNVYNNTAYNTYNIGASGGSIWLTETGLFTGTINIYNNLSSGTVTYGVGNIIGGSQALGTVGYNGWHSTTTPYYQVSIATDQTSSDVTYDPAFFDPSRKLATWDAARGSGTGTESAAIAHLLAINGYNETSKTQSDTPATNGVSDLLSWVKSGFAPTNYYLKTAGSGGTFIGAFDVASTSSAPALLMGM